MDGFERRRQQKKDAILNAALELFKQHGYNRVSISEIASRASVSQVSIYNFFKNKENLKKELIKKLLDNHFQTILGILESQDSVKIKLKKFFVYRINFFKNNSFNFMLESIKEGLSNKKEYIEPEKIKKVDQLVVNIFNEGKKQGVFKENVSIESAAVFIEIFQYYFINNQEATDKFNQNPQLFREILSMLFNSLLKENVLD